jgi:hypothetical protein
MLIPSFLMGIESASMDGGQLTQVATHRRDCQFLTPESINPWLLRIHHTTN